MKIHNKRELKNFRKSLRNESTSAEASLWLLLRNKQLDGRKFRRQHSIGKYVTDFYCPAEKLVVELDGKHHFTKGGAEHDEKRAQYFESLNISTVRFENREVFDHPEAVLGSIRRMFRNKMGATTPERLQPSDPP